MRRAVPFFLVALAATPAPAHLRPSSTHTNRFFEVTATGRELILRYALGYGELPAAVERRAMDLDHDANLSTAELDAWRERLENRLAEAVTVWLDGERQPLRFSGRIQMPDNRLGQIAFAVILEARRPVAKGGEHRLEIADSFEPPMAGELEITFLEGLGGRFLGSRSVGSPETVSRAVTFRGPRRSDMEERRVAFRLRTDPGRRPEAPLPVAPAAPPAPASRWRWAALAMGVAAAVGGGVILSRRRRRS